MRHGVANTLYWVYDSLISHYTTKVIVSVLDFYKIIENYDFV